MKKFRYLLMLCVAGVVGSSVHAMPIGVRTAMMGRAAATSYAARKDIGLAQVNVDCSDVTYCGTAYEPAVQSVKWGDDTLVAGTDFTLAYSGNVDAGTATITLRGINSYKETYTTNFTIRPKLLTEGMVEAIGNHPYTGKAQTPKPTVTDPERGATLREDVEYTLSYANNMAVGEGIVAVTGKGNYTGSVARYFVIEPSAGSELEERLGGAGKAESDGEDGWIVTLTNNVDSADLPIEIPDDIGPVTIDLGGRDLVGVNGEDGGRGATALPGGDGKPAIRIVSGGGDGEPTVLTVITVDGDAMVKGGDGGAGNPGGNGAPAIEVADGARDGVSINIGTGVTVQGGDGGVSDVGRGGDGGAGIVGDVGTNNGTVVGGNGGASDAGDGGNGGPGIDGDVDVNVGDISGGAGGMSEDGSDGESGVGVTGIVGMSVDYKLKAGEYFKATLSELGYDVPTNGTPYSVVAKGLPAGLKLKYNAAVTKKVKGKVKAVVVKPAKVEWWIEGVPTAALDFFTNPPYLVITTNGVAETHALPMEVKAQEMTELDDLELGQSMNTNGWLAGVGAGWSVSGLPTGLKYAAKKVTKKSGKKTVTVAEAYAVYGRATKAGLFTITAKKKAGAFYETMKYRVLVRPAAVDAAVFGEELTNVVTMAYVPVAWDLTGGGRGATALPAVAAVGGKVAKVSGLPTGLTFAAADTYAYTNAKKKTGKYLKQAGQTVVGTPTKPGTYVVTFTKNVKSGKKTVAKTAQILWKVEPNDVEVNLGFNTAGGVIESGVVGLKCGDLLAFSATSNATVTASGLPAGIKLVKVDGSAGGLAPPGEALWGFEGFTTKAGTYLVTVKATLKGRSVTQRLALEVKGLPAWAKGTFNGVVYATGETPVVPVGEDATGGTPIVPVNAQAARSTNGLVTVTVSSVGKISGKFQEFGTNWTFTAASYTARTCGSASLAGGSPSSATEGDAFVCSNIVAKYAYKVTVTVKGKKKSVTKYLARTFNMAISPVPIVPNVPEVPIRGVVQMVEAVEAETAIEAWQNLWGRADYKALGKRLFTSKSGKKTLAYKTVTVNVYTNEVGQACVLKQGDDATGLAHLLTLSLKVTTAGAVTATLSYDTGKTKKDPKTKKTVKVIYKPTCPSVVVPQVAADAEPFAGEVPLYFAPSSANGFEGFAGSVAVP